MRDYAREVPMSYVRRSNGFWTPLGLAVCAGIALPVATDASADDEADSVECSAVNVVEVLRGRRRRSNSLPHSRSRTIRRTLLLKVNARKINAP